MSIFRRRSIGWSSALVLAAVFLVLSAGAVASQGNIWMRLFGTSFSDVAMAVSVDHLGNVYVAGRTAGRMMDQVKIGGDSDAYVLKFDSTGSPVWARQFGTKGNDIAWSVAAGDSGDLFVAGQTAQVPPGRARVSGFTIAFLRKFGSDGSELWSRRFGTPDGVWATGVAVDPAANSYVVGRTEEALPGQKSFGSTDAFIRSYDPSGEERWTRQFGAAGGDFANAIAADVSGNTFVAGSSQGETTAVGRGTQVSIDPFIRKYGPDGTLTWERRIQISGFAEFTAAAVDSQGSLYAAGWVSGAFPGQDQAGGTDAFVKKIDGEGSDVWTHQFGTPKEDRALGIAVDGAGNSYAAGWTRGEFPGQTGLGRRDARVRRDAFIHKIDSQGNGLWTRQLGTRSPQEANGVATNGNGGIYVAGSTMESLLDEPFLGTVDAFLLKLDGGLPAEAPEPTPTSVPTATTAPTSRGPATATPEVITPTAPPTGPTGLQPTKSAGPTLPVSTPSPVPTVTSTERTPNTSTCSAPQPGGGPIPMGWILTALIPASLAAAGWRRRRRKSSGTYPV